MNTFKDENLSLNSVSTKSFFLIICTTIHNSVANGRIFSLRMQFSRAAWLLPTVVFSNFPTSQMSRLEVLANLFRRLLFFQFSLSR